ncbi:MAG: DUF2007 domain-containing protein [Bacteroidetes bacterium]|nr:DUF2007 domain-containing protein [Bacteroidota bacterium]
MDENWAPIFSSTKLYEIELLNGMLSENDIECFIFNKQDSIYLIGEIELYVHIDNIMKAKQLISKYNQSE